MNTPQNSLFIQALQRKPVSRTPVWIMRQAGRYLPEYREVRSQAGNFMSLCQNPELACEVALQPLRRFPLDAAILFSDILTIPDAMGLGLYFVEGEGPCFHNPLQSVAAIEKLMVPDVRKDLSYVTDALRLIRQKMPADLPLIGFSGSPWTLACYAVEGGSSREFNRLKELMKNHPAVAHLLLEKFSAAVSSYLCAQAEAGANALMIFDTWGGLLSTEDYALYSLNYMQYIVHNVKKHHPDLPLILFTKGGGAWLEVMAATGCDALGLDWTSDLHEARQRVGMKVALQGNMNPAMLLQSEQDIRRDALRILQSYGSGTGHIFNLGHGITPDVPPAHLKAMLEAVHEYSPAFHKEET